MSNLRKLQTEIDKTLKRVQEGLQVFDDYWEQVRFGRSRWRDARSAPGQGPLRGCLRVEHPLTSPSLHPSRLL